MNPGNTKVFSALFAVMWPTLEPTPGIIMTLADLFRKEGIEIGEKRGEKRGKQWGLCQALMAAISSRFNSLPDDIAAKIQTIDDEKSLILLTQQAVKCNNLREYRNFVNGI